MMEEEEEEEEEEESARQDHVVIKRMHRQHLGSAMQVDIHFFKKKKKKSQKYPSSNGSKRDTMQKLALKIKQELQKKEQSG